MAIKSITQRWILNSLSVILIAVIAIAVIFAFFIRNFYYTGAKQVITTRANGVSNILIRLFDDDTVNFNAELRSVVENSDEKNHMEITAIDHNGRIALSSSGFSYTKQEAMPDYDIAVKSTGGTGNFVGENSAGEKIMAVTVMIPYINAEYSAIRYVVSMEAVDKLLLAYMFISLLVGIGILGFVMISGSYFIKSIVIPVREVGAAARRFATGDMSTRIVKKSDDELGELCDIINFMADEISNSEELKNEFISSVSHELRTPLTAIKGWGETLMDLPATDKQTLKKGLRVITGETERLSLMVEELLDFSRMQNGRFTLVKTTIDLLAELGDAVLMYTERAQRDNIELIYNEPESLPFFFGDKNRLRQVFINIIDNALKYSDAGGRVEIEAREENGFILISVSDTGCGIDKNDLPKIKAKFYKANITRRGSGIGLAVADEIVLMHDGEILIESEVNVGTTVTIKLPENLKKGETRQTEISTTVEFGAAKADKTEKRI